MKLDHWLCMPNEVDTESFGGDANPNPIIPSLITLPRTSATFTASDHGSSGSASDSDDNSLLQARAQREVGHCMPSWSFKKKEKKKEKEKEKGKPCSCGECGKARDGSDCRQRKSPRRKPLHNLNHSPPPHRLQTDRINRREGRSKAKLQVDSANDSSSYSSEGDPRGKDLDRRGRRRKESDHHHHHRCYHPNCTNYCRSGSSSSSSASCYSNSISCSSSIDSFQGKNESFWKWVHERRRRRRRRREKARHSSAENSERTHLLKNHRDGHLDSPLSSSALLIASEVKYSELNPVADEGDYTAKAWLQTEAYRRAETYPYRRRRRRRTRRDSRVSLSSVQPRSSIQSVIPNSKLSLDVSSENGIFDSSIALQGRVSKNVVAVVKSSQDPYLDFWDTMVDMIVENRIDNASDLKELLQCFLTLNSVEHHQTIIRAFNEIWEKVFPNLQKPSLG